MQRRAYFVAVLDDLLPDNLRAVLTDLEPPLVGPVPTVSSAQPVSATTHHEFCRLTFDCTF